MRILALDIGDVRIGCAVSDSGKSVASPLETITVSSMRQAQQDILRIIDEYEIEELVVGLPLSLNGEEGSQARHIRSLSNKLLYDVSLPVTYFDERLSSVQAKDALISAGVGARESRGKIDMMAASLFLQAYLDQRQEK